MKEMNLGQVVSVNIGRPRQVEWRNRSIRTGIYKEPALGPIWISQLNLNGDAQADLTVHGGIDQAVYLYPSEHYDFWRKRYPELQMPWGMFGENLTTLGLLESEIYSGDQIRIGTAELAVTKPRFPCYKLGMKFGTDSIIKQFFESFRSGFYLSVMKEGYVETGDPIERIRRAEAEDSVTIQQMVIRRAKKHSPIE